MKKFKMYNLKELSKVMQSLSETDKRNTIGAGIVYKFDSKGKLETSYDDGTTGPNKVICNGNELIIDGTLNYSSECYVDESGDRHIGHNITGGGINLFYFLADNTNVEWGASYNDGSQAHINTYHDEHSCNVSYQEGFSNYIHSHTTSGDSQSLASSSDISTGVAMLRRSNNQNDEYDYNYQKFSIYKAHSAGSIDEDTIDYTDDVESIYDQYYGD